MIFDLSGLQEYLGFDLDSNQIDVVIHAIESIVKKQHCCIVGPAGSGKTQIAKAIAYMLRKNNISFLAISPTNKAKLVLGRATDSEALTIHALLSLSPELDLLELDLRNIKFLSKGTDTRISRNGVWLIDECSMINNELYELIIEKAKEYKCSIVFFGDECQLAPVKQSSLSKVFSLSNKYSLTAIYRQDYYSGGQFSDFGKMLNKLRESLVPKFNNIEGDTAAKIYDDYKDWIKTAMPIFEDAIVVHDPGLVRILSYTNERIQSLNKLVRKALNFENEYEVGELLTGYDTIFDLGIENSSDYWVTECIPSKGTIFDLPGYTLTLQGVDKTTSSLFILSQNIDEGTLSSLAGTIENLRLTAVKSKKATDWKKYFSAINSFASPGDLMYNGKIVKKKTLGYGYCISIHKSQGSQFTNVFLDAVSFNKCFNLTIKRQLQYVAVSRTTDIIHIYQ